MVNNGIRRHRLKIFILEIRTIEVRKDNQILAAKVQYLESNKDHKAIDDFLRDICPKAAF